MNSRRALAGAASALVVGAVLAGCSASSTASSTAPAAASPPAAASAAPSSDAQAAFQKVLDDAKAKFDFPGAQAGVWTADGEWYGVTGTSAANVDRPPQRDDHTRIGSISNAPQTFDIDGRQHVLVGVGDMLYAFALY